MLLCITDTSHHPPPSSAPSSVYTAPEGGESPEPPVEGGRREGGLRLLRASPHPSQAPACSSQQPLHSTEPFYRGFPTGGEEESHKIKIMKSFKNGKRKKKKPKQTEIIPSRFFSERSLLTSPAPRLPVPEHPPTAAPEPSGHKGG